MTWINRFFFVLRLDCNFFLQSKPNFLPQRWTQWKVFVACTFTLCRLEVIFPPTLPKVRKYFKPCDSISAGWVSDTDVCACGSTGSGVQWLSGRSRECQRSWSEPELSRPQCTHVLLWEKQWTKPPPASARQLGAAGQWSTHTQGCFGVFKDPL